MAKAMWMVRAERGGKLFDQFKEDKLVAMGLEIGSISDLKNRKMIAERIQKELPSWQTGKVNAWAGMLHRFQNIISVGDGVITYDPSRRRYLVGIITSECIYDATTVPGDPFIRKVEWRGEVARDDLALSTKNSLGAISTLFKLSTESIEDIERALSGEKPDKTEQDEAEQDSEEVELLKDIESKSIEFIKDRISRLDWDEMQELVAGVLRAMGYKTRISPTGPDRGKDIVASPDGFGFESPRIVVEVKHRSGSTMGAQDIRSFLGGRHKDDKGLYVSTGGFTKDAYYEAERANIPLTLMDLEGLVEALLAIYPSLDIESQRLVPLKIIYWPA
jgi:restriction system protein